MVRAHPVVLGASLLLAAGCSDEPTPATEGSTTGGSDDPSTTVGSGSVGATSSGGLDTTTTTDTTTTDTTTTEGSTTGEPSTGHARVLVTNVVGGDRYDIDLVLLEYAAGELTSWTSLTSDLPPGPVGTVVSESGWAAAFCKNSGPIDPSCFAVDLTTQPPGPAQSFFAEPFPAAASLSISSWNEAAQSFVVRLNQPLGTPDALFSAAFPSGVLQEPVQIMQAGPTQSIGQDIFVRSDGAWVSYVLGSSPGPFNAFIAPLAPPDPSAAVMVSDIVDPELRATTPTFIPGQDAVLYTVGDGSYGSSEDSLWFVDIAGPVPTAPLRIDDPLSAGLGIRGPRTAPDGHALLYRVGEDLMVVDLTAGVPQPPVLVSSLVAEPYGWTSFRWSPDSRLITYLAEGELPDTLDLYAVEAPGAALGEPVRITTLFPNQNVLSYTFDFSSSWLYFVAEVDDLTAQLYRVDVSGSEPGAPQQVSSGDGWVSTATIGSSDWSMVLYLARADASSGYELYLVDVAGPVPGEAVRISAPLDEGIAVSRAQFSHNGTVVFYQERGPTGKDPDESPVKLVDLTSGDVHIASYDAERAYMVVD